MSDLFKFHLLEFIDQKVYVSSQSRLIYNSNSNNSQVNVYSEWSSSRRSTWQCCETYRFQCITHRKVNMLKYSGSSKVTTDIANRKLSCNFILTLYLATLSLSYIVFQIAIDQSITTFPCPLLHNCTTPVEKIPADIFATVVYNRPRSMAPRRYM